MAIEPLDDEQLDNLFFLYSKERTEVVKKNGGRFVYYTNAEVASSILRNREIWMRNASVMSDFKEISHGMECVTAAWGGASGDVLKRALNSAFPGLPEEVETLFNGWSIAISVDTYLTCVSEHRNEEDQRGRLSMWRAYGGATGVALVMNSTAMFSPSNALNAFSSPVFYGDATTFASEFMREAKAMQAEIDFIKLWPRETIKNAAFQMLRFAVLCTKHPGFAEELEWRVIASPTMHPSTRLSQNIELVRGVPQTVLKIKLENVPEEGFFGASPPELINRVIIGPCDYPLVTYGAFFRLLEDLQVPEPGNKIFISDIPLRHR